MTAHYCSAGVPARDWRAWGQARYSVRMSLYSEILKRSRIQTTGTYCRVPPVKKWLAPITGWQVLILKVLSDLAQPTHCGAGEQSTEN